MVLSAIAIGVLAVWAALTWIFRKSAGSKLIAYTSALAITLALGMIAEGFGPSYAYLHITAVYLLSVAGVLGMFGAIEFGILRLIGLFRLGAITRITYYEALLQPFTIIVVVMGIAAITILAFVPYYTMGEDYKMYRDVAISMAFLFTLPIMVFASTKVIDEEIENRTMLTLMSKPIARWQVVIGKYFGVTVLCLGVIAALGIIAGTCAYLRYFDDMRIDYFVSRTVQENDLLNLNNTKAVLAIIPSILLEFLQLAMLAAVSVAISTRWGLALNVTATVILYIGANISRYAVAMDLPAPLSWVVWLVAHLLPNLASMDLSQRLVYGNFNYGNRFIAGGNTPSYGQIWQYVGIASAYAVFYVSGVLSCGVAMFRTRELT
ncbi:MAG TPA: ABC transporter permease subunit [Phycisphaerae bacterium]|nr:ABC transporter permease subunit [Phycisphaerae bacterium]